ncbi:MAG: hypothetical protein ABJN84_14795 [Flavobacteriaceae bacterium]
MNTLRKVLTWKRNNIIIVMILLPLIPLNFYGVYADRFYFFKPTNYIFPLLTLVHFLYLYVLRFKITEGELPDPKMRNLEYVVYGALLVYCFKIYDYAMVLHSISQFQGYIMPATSRPIATIGLSLHCLLPIVTLVSFWYRKHLVGNYNFENYNHNMNIWQ